MDIANVLRCILYLSSLLRKEKFIGIWQIVKMKGFENNLRTQPLIFLRAKVFKSEILSN